MFWHIRELQSDCFGSVLEAKKDFLHRHKKGKFSKYEFSSNEKQVFFCQQYLQEQFLENV